MSSESASVATTAHHVLAVFSSDRESVSVRRLRRTVTGLAGGVVFCLFPVDLSAASDILRSAEASHQGALLDSPGEQSTRPGSRVATSAVGDPRDSARSAGKDPVCAMGWLRIDDGFEDHAKVEPLSHAAHRLWMRAACWCRKPANQHTSGFVPEALLVTISKHMAPKPRLLKLAQELVNANGGGAFECGLWEVTVGGWLFHDWAKYQPEPEKKPTMSRSEAARIAGERSAEARREKFGTAQPGHPNEPPNEPPNDSRTINERSEDVRPNDVHRTTIERPEPPDPIPVPSPDPGPTDQNPASPPAEGPGATGQPEKPKVRARDRFRDSFDAPHPEDLWGFERWQVVCEKTDSEPDLKRLQCLRERREAGMTRQDLEDALVGAKADEWAQSVFFKLPCIFGDPGRYEGFRDSGRAIRTGKVPVKTKRGSPQPKQPNSGYLPPVEDA